MFLTMVLAYHPRSDESYDHTDLFHSLVLDGSWDQDSLLTSGLLAPLLDSLEAGHHLHVELFNLELLCDPATLQPDFDLYRVTNLELLLRRGDLRCSSCVTFPLQLTD